MLARGGAPRLDVRAGAEPESADGALASDAGAAVDDQAAAAGGIGGRRAEVGRMRTGVGGTEFAGELGEDGLAGLAERADALFGVVGERLVRCFEDEISLDAVAVCAGGARVAAAAATARGGRRTVAGTTVVAGDDTDRVAVGVHRRDGGAEAAEMGAGFAAGRRGGRAGGDGGGDGEGGGGGGGSDRRVYGGRRGRRERSQRRRARKRRRRERRGRVRGEPRHWAGG